MLCDKSKMRQILVNLLGNAQKFTQSGGTVSLAFEQTGEDAYRFTVRDTGIGISRSFQEHMFEAFERERTSTESSTTGTGLGLSIVKRLVELMDGRITVDSTPGSGTSIAVTLSLPPADSAPADAPVPEPPAQEAPASSLSGVHILLVEDNELNREIADTLLGAEGALVTNAVNGAEAVELFRSNPPGTFRLILMDIMMPGHGRSDRRENHPCARPRGRGNHSDFRHDGERLPRGRHAQSGRRHERAPEQAARHGAAALDHSKISVNTKNSRFRSGKSAVFVCYLRFFSSRSIRRAS